MAKNQIKKTTRFINFMVDSIVFSIIAFVIVSILVRYHPAFKIYNPWNNRFLAFVLYFLYYFLFETIFSSTPGKLITNTNIVDTITFKSPSVLKIFIRSLCRFIPLEALSIFFYKNNLVWHDIISGTIIISKS
jgi:uncharacterized RDD family membrane protein YckC